MFKQLVFFFCLSMAVYGAWQAYVTLAPPETQIRWTIDGAAEAYNEKNKAECLAYFADDYKDSSTGEPYQPRVVDKQLLAQGLDYMFTNRLEAETGHLLYKAHPVMDTFQVKLQSEIHAEAQVRVLFKLKTGHIWTDAWSVHVTARCRKVGRRWLIARTSLRTLFGARIWNWD